jgi:hypothetical protein
MMSAVTAHRLPTAAVAVALLAGVTGGCSLLDRDKGGFAAALGRIAATDATRSAVAWDDTAALLALVGDERKPEGFGRLAFTGYPGLGLTEPTAEADVKLALRRATFVVSAGRAPDTVGLVAGGQRPDRVRDALTALGWKLEGDRLVHPGMIARTEPASRYSIQLNQVRGDGEDVVIGLNKATLSSAGHPGGPTLADDARISALAECLGDVVAATVSAETGAPAATAVAIGVPRPSSRTDEPRAVVCVSWSDQAAADRYAEGLAGVLRGGDSRRTGRPWSELLRDTEVDRPGGDERIVRWRAATPGRAGRVSEMLLARDLPGLAT